MASNTIYVLAIPKCVFATQSFLLSYRFMCPTASVWMLNSWPLNFKTWLSLLPSSLICLQFLSSQFVGNPNLPIAYAPNLGVILDMSLSFSHILLLICQELCSTWSLSKCIQNLATSHCLHCYHHAPRHQHLLLGLLLGLPWFALFPPPVDYFQYHSQSDPFKMKSGRSYPPLAQTLQWFSFLLKA